MIGRNRLLTVALAGLLVLAPAFASAQSTPPSDTESETGDDNEYGVIRTPYQVKMDGDELQLEARMVIKNHYVDQSTTYFMFAASTRTSPALYTSITSLKTVDGEPLKVHEKKQEQNEEQWFVDIEDMPPVGTEIVLQYTVGSTSKGYYHVGAMSVPFDYRWQQVTMSDGEPAKIYGFTQVGVEKETRGGGGLGFRSPLGDDGGRFTPAPGAFLALAGVAVAALAVGARRRRG